MPLQLTFLSVVGKLDVDEAFVGKLDRILDQIDQDLLKTRLIAMQ